MFRKILRLNARIYVYFSYNFTYLTFSINLFKKQPTYFKKINRKFNKIKLLCTFNNFKLSK